MHILGSGPLLVILDWILFCGVIPHRAVARKTLDGVPIRFFILKIIFQILVDLLECVIKLLRFECVAWISVESPSSDRVSQSHGWKNIARVWIAFYYKPNPTIILLLLVLFEFG